MSPREEIEAYVLIVCEQIRWKKAHNRVASEIEAHIIDQRDFYISQGLDEAEATENAIADTGDATEIGIQLDRTHRPKRQWGMLIMTAVLLALGLLIRLLIHNDTNTAGELSARLLYTGIGIIGMLAAYFTDFSLIGKYPRRYTSLF